MKNKGILEALLFAAGDEGLTIAQIAAVLETSESLSKEVVEALMKDYKKETRGIQLVQLAGVYQLTTKKIHAEYLKKLVQVPGTQGLTQAALETLAIIAYKQPITRMEIEEIRGVKTERPLQTLISRALIKEAGRVEGAGRAFLYKTTKEFMDHFGLKSLDELPPLKDNTAADFEEGEADLFFEKFQENMK